MNYTIAVDRIYPEAVFNPACFNFTEQEAREKKLWTDERPMPTEAELLAELEAYNAERAAIVYKENREKEYPSTDELVVALWEKVVEGRSDSSNALETKRQAVKIKHPKP